MKPCAAREEVVRRGVTRASVSARSGSTSGTSMSGVTVAQRQKVDVLPRPGPCQSCWRPEAEIVTRCSGAAIRRSRMPVRSMIHRPRLSYERRELGVRQHPVGTYAPSPVIEIRRPLGLANHRSPRPRLRLDSQGAHRSTAESQGRPASESPSTRAPLSRARSDRGDAFDDHSAARARHPYDIR